ncbi:MAG TPA: hypothetical protein VME43_08525 [Bryobacteraceae bacterium]|nr:hypothetical protein [Bryobacteraceae bacterium]
MKSACVAVLFLAASPAARADFSFTMTQKSGPGNGMVVKHAIKGQKEVEDRGRVTTVMDFDAQTLTTIDHNAKTYKVVRFSDLGNNPRAGEVQADVQNTGRKKTINGFEATELLMTVQLDAARGSQPGFKGQMEVELWMSKDVPGSQELRAFYRRNAAHWPVGGSDGSASMQKAMAKLQQQFAELDAVPVLEVIRMKSGAGASPYGSQMDQARARLEALAKGGGPNAAGAQQALDRLNAMSGGGSLFDVTMESGNFSSAPVPDSLFAIPAGYRKVDK